MDKDIDVKVILTQDIYRKITDDKDTFNLNLTSNSEFIRNIIIKTYKYQNKIKKLEKIKKIILDPANINNDLINSIQIQKDKDCFNQQLTDLSILLSTTIFNEEKVNNQKSVVIHIKETKYTYNEIRNIINETNQLHYSDVCKSLIYDYLSYPLYTREKILFSEKFDKLMFNKKNHIASTITTQNDNDIPLDLFDIIPGKSEFHYYVLGFIHGENKKFCIKLCNIKNIHNDKGYSLTNELIEDAENSISYGAEWFASGIKETSIKLDERGLELYNQIYKDRPKDISRIKDEEYTIMKFNCSDDQIFTYFIHFGRHAVVLDNDKLYNRFSLFYSNASKAYSTKNIS